MQIGKTAAKRFIDYGFPTREPAWRWPYSRVEISVMPRTAKIRHMGSDNRIRVIRGMAFINRSGDIQFDSTEFIGKEVGLSIILPNLRSFKVSRFD
jgi:hypothetical protein